MRPHTDKEIIGKAQELTPPPHEYPKDDLYIEVKFYDLGDPIVYEVYYTKGVVHGTPGWIPVEIEQLK